MPTQVHHWAKLSDAVSKMRWRKLSAVMRTIASTASAYRLSCMTPGIADRSKIVFCWSRHRSAPATWNTESVVSSIVAAITAPSWWSPIW